MTTLVDANPQCAKLPLSIYKSRGDYKLVGILSADLARYKLCGSADQKMAVTSVPGLKLAWNTILRNQSQ